MKYASLAQVVIAKPYPDFMDWWPMGPHFLTFMAHAIHTTWRNLFPQSPDLTEINDYITLYIHAVYQRSARPTLATAFVESSSAAAIQSGEFDALSYAFFRSAFEQLARLYPDPTELTVERRRFTKKVGKRFFAKLADHLRLNLPTQLLTQADYTQLTNSIDQVGSFLVRESYLRDHFTFKFDVQTSHQGRTITQRSSTVLETLRQNSIAYALYEMGYPAILPSAVYLYHTLGEAQHHSSRTIEELFERVGCQAAETADFDPTGYPADMVVELWEIRLIEQGRG